MTAPSNPSQPAAPRADAQNYDGVVLFLAATLMCIGAVMVYSASVTPTRGADLNWSQWWRTPLKQCIFSVMGLLAMFIAAMANYRFWRWETKKGWRRAGAVFAVSLLLVIAMYVPGVGERQMGAARAVALIPGVFTFQPAEAAKIAVVLWLAALLTSPHFRIRDFKRGYLVAAGSVFALVGAVAMEDLGTGAVLGVVMVLMLWAGGARLWHLGATGLLGLVAGGLFVLAKPYRLERLVNFFGGEADPAGGGYQIRQALMAIGSGGWWGRGLGAGVQKYGYLPMDSNDFILAIVCEELGVVGGLVVVALFVTLLARGWWIARTASEPFGRMVAMGVTLTLCIQAAFNVAVVTDSVPTKGISLPFVSAGGSGVIFLGLAAGLLASVGGRRGQPAESAAPSKT